MDIKAVPPGRNASLRCAINQRVAPSPLRATTRVAPTCCSSSPYYLSPGQGGGLDFAVLSLDGSRFTSGCCARCSIARACSSLTVGFLADALQCALRGIGGRSDAREIAACKRIAHGPDLVFDLTA